MRRAAATIAGLILLLLAATGYTAYAGTAVYQSLDSGRIELAEARATLDAAAQSVDPAQLGLVAVRLKRAEQDFDDAYRRSTSDPALHLMGVVAPAGRQVSAAAHLALIGGDVSRAGEAAAVVAGQVGALTQKYSGRRLSPDDLLAILQQAQAIARSYSASTTAIGQQLRAAHAERAQVTTTGLLPALKTAYEEVDRALAEADTAFLRYQDVRQVLSQFLRVALPA